MLENTLERLAEKIIKLDEASLTQLLPIYKQKMETFSATPEWEKAVIIYFLINSVRVKNTLFNENVLKASGGPGPDKDRPLRLVK